MNVNSSVNKYVFAAFNSRGVVLSYWSVKAKECWYRSLLWYNWLVVIISDGAVFFLPNPLCNFFVGAHKLLFTGSLPAWRSHWYESPGCSVSNSTQLDATKLVALTIDSGSNIVSSFTLAMIELLWSQPWSGYSKRYCRCTGQTNIAYVQTYRFFIFIQLEKEERACWRARLTKLTQAQIEGRCENSVGISLTSSITPLNSRNLSESFLQMIVEQHISCPPGKIWMFFWNRLWLFCLLCVSSQTCLLVKRRLLSLQFYLCFVTFRTISWLTHRGKQPYKRNQGKD